MERELLKQILESLKISKHTISSILSGRRRPGFDKMVVLSKKHKIPFEAWIDIKTYLQNNDTKKQKQCARKLKDDA